MQAKFAESMKALVMFSFLVSFGENNVLKLTTYQYCRRPFRPMGVNAIQNGRVAVYKCKECIAVFSTRMIVIQSEKNFTGFENATQNMKYEPLIIPREYKVAIS